MRVDVDTKRRTLSQQVRPVLHQGVEGEMLPDPKDIQDIKRRTYLSLGTGRGQSVHPGV